MNPTSGKPVGRVVLETGRLILRELTPGDGAFILRLLNEPSFLRFVGDKGIRTVADAIAWIENGPRAMYARYGYGLYRVELRETAEPIGICGLVNRDWLADPDIGFSLLPSYWSQGYALEASRTVMNQARQVHGLNTLLAITNSDNASSIRLLSTLGFSFQGQVRTPDGKEELSVWGFHAE